MVRQDLAAEAEIGKIYKGTVSKDRRIRRIRRNLPGTDGLVSYFSAQRRSASKRLPISCKEGDEVMVKVLEIDRQGKIRLSRKEALEESGQTT